MAAIKNKIYIGSTDNPDFYFENENIDSANVVQTVALVGKELSIDTFTPVVSDDEGRLHDIYHFRSSDGYEIELGDGSIYCIDVSEGTNVSPLITLARWTPVWYMQENTLIGKFYFKSAERVGRNKYKLNTVSAIGVLDEMDHCGGLFLSSTFGTVLAHIMASGVYGPGDPQNPNPPVIDYLIEDEELENLPVSIWLPHDTKRNNLYQLIFANGVNIVKDLRTGNPRFTFIYTAPANPEPIDIEHIYDQGSVSYESPYANVVVMEHTYTPLLDAEPVTLFDNTSGTTVSSAPVWFTTAPIIVSTLAVSGTLAIDEDPVTHDPLVGENYAIVSGNGKLTGIPYLHDTRAVSLGDDTASEEKTIRVENATGVNTINSENLLLRLFAFYCRNQNQGQAPYIQKISNGIVYGERTIDDIHYEAERCGKVYRFVDPYGLSVSAYLASMTIEASAINKADSEWYAGYVPAGQAGLYQNVDILVPYPDETDPETLIYSGIWVVPDGVTRIKAVMIGGGTGGDSGWPGANGDDAYTYTNIEETADLSGAWFGAEGGDGGAGGTGGTPGRVKVVTLNNVLPGSDYLWTVGHGGEGGAATGFIPDTADELRAALRAEDPEAEYSAAEIADMLDEEAELTDWDGSPNAGTAGTATTFVLNIAEETPYSTDDPDAYVPTGGVYDPIGDNYYALHGNTGIRGGKGGARRVGSNGTFNWVTDGEDVTGDDGTVYRGGSTGRMLTEVSGLPEASIKAYGGNGAGAAVGIGRDMVTPETGLLLHPHINGASDQSTFWEVLEENGA